MIGCLSPVSHDSRHRPADRASEQRVIRDDMHDRAEQGSSQRLRLDRRTLLAGAGATATLAALGFAPDALAQQGLKLGDSGDFTFEALKAIRGLYPIEDRILNNQEMAPATIEQIRREIAPW